MTTPRRTSTAVSLQRSEEIRQAEVEVARAEELLVEAELRVATLKQQLAMFEERYRRLAAGLCEELEQLTAQLTPLCAERLRRHDRPGRAQADWTRSTSDSAEPAWLEPSGFTPSESLQKLYREVAKRFHPDLADDEKDREWRTQMMRQANAAYADGDSETLQRLLTQHGRDPLASTEPLTQLTALRRKLLHLRARIDEVLGQEREIEASDIGLLYSQAKKSGRDPVVFLRDLVVALKAEIDEKRELLNDLMATEKTDERKV
jgi:hypothetical protein